MFSIKTEPFKANESGIHTAGHTYQVARWHLLHVFQFLVLASTITMCMGAIGEETEKLDLVPVMRSTPPCSIGNTESLKVNDGGGELRVEEERFRNDSVYIYFEASGESSGNGTAPGEPLPPAAISSFPLCKA